MILALDYEVGGTQPGTHGPVTLGVAAMEGETVLASREWLFAPAFNWKGEQCREYTAEAEAIHGVSFERMVEEGVGAVSVMGSLGNWAIEHGAVGSRVVAYNAPFDFAVFSDCLFLASSYDRQRRRFEPFKSPLLGAWHCGRILATSMLDLPNYKLDTVAGHFGLARTTDRHGAAEDSILAGKIYARLQALHQERKER